MNKIHRRIRILLGIPIRRITAKCCRLNIPDKHISDIRSRRIIRICCLLFLCHIILIHTPVINRNRQTISTICCIRTEIIIADINVSKLTSTSLCQTNGIPGRCHHITGHICLCCIGIPIRIIIQIKPISFQRTFQDIIRIQSGVRRNCNILYLIRNSNGFVLHRIEIIIQHTHRHGFKC